MSNLLHFLTNLAINPREQEAFAKYPDAVMDKAGLSKSDRAMLKSGDGAQIAVTFADKLFQYAFFITDPNPDPFPDPDPPDSDPPDSDFPEEATRALSEQHTLK